MLILWMMASTVSQRWSNRTRVLVLEYEYFMSNRTHTRVQGKVIVLVLILKYIAKVIVLTITSHDYIFSYELLQSKYIRQIEMEILLVI